MGLENDSLAEAYDKCSRLAYSHYENFPVARLVPKKIRRHVAAVYAFARTADDIADERHDELAADDPARVAELALFESQLDLPLELDFRRAFGHDKTLRHSRRSVPGFGERVFAGCCEEALRDF